MRNYRNSFTNSNYALPQTFSTSKLSFSNKSIENSPFSAAHFDTLLTYRSYLLHEVKCVDIQIQRDSAEFNLMIHRHMEAQSILKQERQELNDQLNARRGQLRVKEDSRESIELVNINSLARTKQVVEMQQKLARMNHTLKLQNQSLRTEVKRKIEEREAIIQKMRAKEKDYKQASQNISSKNKEIATGKQREKHLYQIVAKLKEEKEIKMKSISSQSQKYIETVEKLRAEEEEKSYLQNVAQILKCKVLQLQNRKIEVGCKLESCRQHRLKIENKEQQINYALQMALTQLEIQQRHRQNEQDKIKAEKERIKQNKQRLNKLKSYIIQLKQNNNIISKVMKNFKKQDEFQIVNILLKIKVQNDQFMNSLFDKNIKMVDCTGQAVYRQKTGKIQQSDIMERERKEFNQKQLETKSKQNILKGYFKFCNIQQNGDNSDDYSHINQDQIQHTDNILETQSRVDPNINQNQPQPSTKLEQNPITFPLFISTRPSHNCQFKTYRMPEQVSNIVNKFKPSPDSNILQSISQTRITALGKQNYDISAQNKCKFKSLSFGTMFGLRNVYGGDNSGCLGRDEVYGKGVGESGERVG